jgi:hypothetical protein
MSHIFGFFKNMYYNIRPKSAPKRVHYGAFTFDVKSVLNENLGSILGSTQC